MKESISDVEDGRLLDLVARAQSGDNGALSDLLDRYRPLLLGNVRKVGRYLEGNVLEREDLEQEATKIAAELIQEFDPQSTPHFGSFLKQKLRWRLINYLRRERSRMKRNVELDVDACDRLIQTLETKPSPEIANPRLRAAVKRLSPKQKSVLFKLYWQDRTADEVASEMGVTDVSVRALKRRAEERIRHVIADNTGAG